MLRIYLFGHLSASAEGEPLRLGAAGAALPLWAYVLLHHDQQLPRTHVAFTLWPDSTEEEALAQLRRQLHVLQHHLPPAPEGRPWLLADRANVGWNANADYWLDVEEFESLCGGDEAATNGVVESSPASEADRLERAIALHSSDLLQDYYDDWALTHRERCRRIYGRALTRLLSLYAANGDLHAAVTTAERLVEHDDLCEEYHRLVIGLHYVDGDRAAALRAFNDCQRILTDELGVEPMAQTSELAGAIRASDPPEAVLRLLRADLPEAVDLTLVARSRVPTNLPMALTKFIGREREIAEVARLLASNRLVTLTGAAGCGKTRLALEVAARVLSCSESAGGSSDSQSDSQHAAGESSAGSADSPGADASAGRYTSHCPPCPDGVWWVDFALLPDAASAPDAIASAMGVAASPGLELTELLERAVRSKSMLLVADNAEHAVQECAVLCERLLRAGPGLRVLATSREVMGVAGEAIWPMRPLSVPPAETDLSVECLLEHEAPQLLLDRAQLSVPGFVLTEDNAGPAAAVCLQLGGNPLAIELTAARLRDMPLAEVAARLPDRFALTTRGSRTAPPRHRTLCAAIDWSHELLPAAERTLLRRLGVFQGGWSLVAAEEVCSGESLRKSDVLDLLASLVDKSLVAVRRMAGTRRYRMPQSIRQYARDRLTESGETDAVRKRHIAFFLSLAEETEPHLTGSSAARYLDQLELEHANLRAALEWAAEDTDDLEAARRLAVALWRFWTTHSHFAEGREWLDRFAKAESGLAPTKLNARILYCSGSMALSLGDVPAAEERISEALDMFRNLGDKEGESWALNDLGMAALHRRDNDRAIALYEESLALKRELGNMWDIARSLVNLGEMAWRAGDYGRAEALYREGLANAQAAGALADREFLSVVNNNLGELALCRADHDRAAAFYREALTLCHEIGDRYRLTFALAGLGGAATGQGRPRRGARLLAAAVALREELGASLDPDNQAEHDRMEAAAHAHLIEPDWQAAVSEGRAMSLEDAVAYALEEAEGQTD